MTQQGDPTKEMFCLEPTYLHHKKNRRYRFAGLADLVSLCPKNVSYQRFMVELYLDPFGRRWTGVPFMEMDVRTWDRPNKLTIQISMVKWGTQQKSS